VAKPSKGRIDLGATRPMVAGDGHRWSRNDTATRRAIVGFVQAAARDVAPQARVAVFDNDDTPWCEKPMPIELGFILERLADMAQQDVALRDRQPWKAAHTEDRSSTVFATPPDGRP
jgi:hypothetical protein